MKKRIALSAVVAMFAGLLVAAPASAATSATPLRVLTAEAKDETTLTAITATQIAGANNYVELGWATGNGYTSANSATQQLYASISGGSFLSAGLANATLDTAATTATITDATNTATSLRVGTLAAGTITVKLYVRIWTGGVAADTPLQTATITVNSAATVGVISATKSTAVMAKVGAAILSTDAKTVTASKGTAKVATVTVTLNDGNNTAVQGAAADFIVSVSGSGLVSVDNGATFGRYFSVANDADGVLVIDAWGDATAGIGVITVTAGAFSASRTVKYFGDIAKLVASVDKKHIADGVVTNGVFTVTATDAAGVPVTGLTTLKAASGDTAKAPNGAFTDNGDGTYSVAVTPVAAASGAVTYTFSDTTFTSVSTTAVVGISNVNAASVTVTTDKATYAPGEKITFTFTAKDANGLGLPDGSYAADKLVNNPGNPGQNPTLTTAMTSFPFDGNAAITLVAGVGTATAYAPLATGPVTLTWTLDGTAGGAATPNLAAALVGTKVSASFNVVAPATAQETANATAIADQKKAVDALTTNVAALQVTMASLVASITASIKGLNAAIAKIAKKLKIKI